MLFALILSGSVLARSPSWFQERMQEIDSAHALSKDEQIELLGVLVGIGQSPMDDEQRLVYLKAETALLAIPGHAEYYRDKILQSQERAKTIGPYALSNYAEEIMYSFQTLPLLPSPEGVSVLGELLSNDWVPPGNDTAIASEKFLPLSLKAMDVLTRFPILDKPFKTPLTMENVADAQAAWRLWYEQIKSGERTFRFEGDPTEYDLHGPAPGQKLEHISRDRKRDTEREAGHERIAESPVAAPSKSMPVALLIASIVLLASLGWYFAKARSRGIS